MQTQNMPNEYRLIVTLRLYAIPLHRYPEFKPRYPSLYVPVDFITIAARPRIGLSQAYCNIPRFMARKVCGSEISTVGRQWLRGHR